MCGDHGLGNRAARRRINQVTWAKRRVKLWDRFTFTQIAPKRRVGWLVMGYAHLELRCICIFAQHPSVHPSICASRHIFETCALSQRVRPSWSRLPRIWRRDLQGLTSWPWSRTACQHSGPSQRTFPGCGCRLFQRSWRTDQARAIMLNAGPESCRWEI